MIHEYTHTLLQTFFDTYLPISGSLSFFEHFEARDFLSKEFDGDGHQQAAAISVAAGGVDHQENHQEDQHDDANHAAFGHAAAAHFDRRERWKSEDDLTESMANIFFVASNTFLLVNLSHHAQYWSVV